MTVNGLNQNGKSIPSRWCKLIVVRGGGYFPWCHNIFASDGGLADVSKICFVCVCVCANFCGLLFRCVLTIFALQNNPNLKHLGGRSAQESQPRHQHLKKENSLPSTTEKLIRFRLIFQWNSPQRFCQRRFDQGTTRSSHQFFWKSKQFVKSDPKFSKTRFTSAAIITFQMSTWFRAFQMEFSQRNVKRIHKRERKAPEERTWASDGFLMLKCAQRFENLTF